MVSLLKKHKSYCCGWCFLPAGQWGLWLCEFNRWNWTKESENEDSGTLV
ncbi:hypothetical protein [Jeotgalibacillus soli]|uniref:Uncharacterized protein n=1 Tax=Jeotgalibacillus soli TaxID=889306 RepID=A0A0C2RQX1_9BACL|nr:hypothetical protein [Jeotgalibacillus soli]KIL44139.1 hypothetical protein KP78_31030 [Jeotgalibacillus soli]